MDKVKKYLNEFEWVMRVLDSCNTKSQAIASIRLFDYFVSKWSQSDIEIEEFLISHSDQFNKKFETSWGTI